VRARHIVALSVLIASFALDGLATSARNIVLAVVPKWFLLSVAEVGDPAILAAMVATLFASGLVARRSRFTRAAVVLASALTATGLVVLSLKWLASRGPDGVFYGFGAGEGGIMFPSGHTAMAFAACVVIGAVWRKARWPACAIAVGVAISRVCLAHFFSDVVAGAVIGAAVGQGVVDWAGKERFLELDSGRHAEPAPDPASPPAKR